MLGRYRLIRRLGSGAMGDVYVAEDPQIDRRVAIKTVRLAGARDEEVEERKRRLVREAKAAGRLIHPHVVTLFDAGEEEGLCYLAFELIDGPDLAERLRQVPPLTVGEALQIARETLEALDYAHQHGIIHRDIKPSNILLDRRAGVKVSDFGIAKLVGQTSELTMTGSVVGSPHYLSPEQIKGEELDGRSDLFSLGVVLYEMLARGKPFAGETITTLVYQILHTDPPAVSARHPEISPPVVSLVAKLMAKDRNQRFATAADAVDAVREAEGSLSPQELAESAPRPDATEATRLIRTAPTAQVGGPPPTPTAGATAEVTPWRRSGLWLAIAVLALVAIVGIAGGAWYWHRWSSRSTTAQAVEGTKPQGASSPSVAQSAAVAAQHRPVPEATNGSHASTASPPVTETPALPSTAKAAAAPRERRSTIVGAAGEEGPRVGRPGAREDAMARRPAPSSTSGTAKEQERVRPAVKQEGVSVPAASESEPTKSVEPHPDTVVDGGLQVQIQSAPKDSFVAVRGPGDSRFRTLGRADELPGKDQIHLPSAGNYLVRLRRERMKDFVARVHAQTGLPPARIVAHMREIQAKELALGDLPRYRAGSAIGFRVDPPNARVLVDGRQVGLARNLSGGRFGRGHWLELKSGVYRVSLEAPGYRRKDIAVEIFPGAEPARRRLEIHLERAQ